MLAMSVPSLAQNSPKHDSPKNDSRKYSAPAVAEQSQPPSAVPEPPPIVVADADRANARAAAERILQQREFRRLKPPGLRESLIDRLTEALLKFMSNLLGHAPDLGVLWDVIVWGIVLLAVAALCLWLWRTTRDAFQNPIPSTSLVGQRVSDTPWQEWLRMAREAADRGDFRGAIHFGYWAGIAAMEGRGTWKPDRARTPREYLSLVSTEHYTTLKSLTRELERTWYAQQSATAADFQNCLSQLERLGCQ